MTTFRKNWRLMSLVLVTAIVGGGWLFSASATSMNFFAMMQGPPETFAPLDPVRHDAVRNLLAKVSLDRDALVALNLSATQAESVLSTTRSWYITNETTLQSLQNSIHAKVHAVRVLEKAERMGPADELRKPALALARTDLVTARTAYDSALNPLKTSVNTALSASQQATWTAIQSGWGQQMPIRMLALTGPQRLAVSKSVHTFRRQRAAAAGKTARDTAVSAHNTSLDGILTAEQKTAMASYNSNYATASANVAGAIDTVLPKTQG